LFIHALRSLSHATYEKHSVIYYKLSYTVLALPTFNAAFKAPPPSGKNPAKTLLATKLLRLDEPDCQETAKLLFYEMRKFKHIEKKSNSLFFQYAGDFSLQERQ